MIMSDENGPTMKNVQYLMVVLLGSKCVTSTNANFDRLAHLLSLRAPHTFCLLFRRLIEFLASMLLLNSL
jgi:hypothetical protein